MSAISNMWLKSPQSWRQPSTRQCYTQDGGSPPQGSVTHKGYRCTPKVLVVVVLFCPLQKVLQTSDKLVIAEHSHTARKAPHLTTT